MPELNDVIWEVKVEQNKGFLKANKHILKKEALAQKLNNNSSAITMVDFSQGAYLDSVIIANEGPLPPGIIPLIKNSAEHDGIEQGTISLIWLCLAYIVPNNSNHSDLNINQDTVHIRHESQAEAKSSQSSDDLITQSQKRYLFRLLSERDIKGTSAENYILKALSVDNINQASRKSASNLIDQLLNNQGGEHT